MAQQKLYTEEQVRKAINDGSLYSYINGNFEFKNSEDDIINALAQIELPSDEEIGRKSVEYSTDTETKEFYKDCCWDFQNGAKWMRDKILNK